MSLNGFAAMSRFAMAFPLSVADDRTFALWMALPTDDLRTIEEFAANPVDRDSSWYFGTDPRTAYNTERDSLTEDFPLCPHGWYDTDRCPDCCH